MVKICVLRLGHRKIRDQRITTHVFLAARALGAIEGVLCGEKDLPIVKTVESVGRQWGGDFKVKYEKNWKRFLKSRKKQGWKVVHLTMYGEDFSKKTKEMDKGNWVVVVGSGKVPFELYKMVDCNLAVTNQPHSEVAALAMFLDRVFKGRELGLEFGGRIKIVPDKCGKVVVRGKNH